MPGTKYKRQDRRFPASKNQSEFRSWFDRDHDRILYSSAFRRLAGVTQVINPSEGQIFHNRLTHSIKVAQIGRRIAEKMLLFHGTRKLLPLGGLNPSVVEAAALAHDLGNPPFGHIAEKKLNELVRDDGVEDGFEGNAQSFRIVNKLAFGYWGFPGLNLTRATMNAILKYPWMDGKSNSTKKFGAYQTEKEEFEWSREMCPKLGTIKTIEAAIMDLADDITYAVHDFEDFYRANLIPIGQIWKDLSKEQLCDIVIDTKETWFPFALKKADLEKIITDFLLFVNTFPLKSPFRGGSRERVGIHTFSSSMISRFIQFASPNFDLDQFPSPITLSKEASVEIILLKYITMYYVINQPILLRQQFGETEIIQNLYGHLSEASKCKSEWVKIFPMVAQERLRPPDFQEISDVSRIRIVTDTISYLSDNEATRLYVRLNGFSLGSVFDNLIT